MTLRLLGKTPSLRHPFAANQVRGGGALISQSEMQPEDLTVGFAQRCHGALAAAAGGRA
jgi:hypothetical protein